MLRHERCLHSAPLTSPRSILLRRTVEMSECGVSSGFDAGRVDDNASLNGREAFMAEAHECWLQ